MLTQEDHSKKDYTPEYVPENYTQAEINEGQRKINGSLCEVDQKLVKALKALRDVIAGTPGLSRIDLQAVDEAISAAYDESDKVADIIPPGCYYEG